REIIARAADTRIAGFIDDDPRKAGIRVMGYPVLGGYSALTVLVNAASIDAVVISARTLVPERMHNLHVLCSRHNVELSRLTVGFDTLVEVDRDRAGDVDAGEVRREPERKLRSL